MNEIDFSKMAVVTIDMQRDTLAGRKLEIKGTTEILPNLKKTLESARKRKIPIIHIIRIYLEDGSNAEPIRRKMILSGKKILSPNDEGTEIFEDVLPNTDIKLNTNILLNGELQNIGENEFILYKPRWGAFYNTKLNDVLQEFSIKSICFIGVNFPNCPRTSIYEASERDYEVYVIKDAISGIYDKGIDELSNIGVHILNTQDFLSIP